MHGAIPSTVLAAALSVALVACSGDDSDDAADSTESSSTAEAEEQVIEPLWSNPRHKPVSVPVAVADKVAFYTAQGGELSLKVIDPETGDIVADLPSSSSYTTPGVSMEVEVRGDLIYHYRPTGEHQEAELEIYDAREDEVVGTSSPEFFWGGPTSCDGQEGGPLCVVAGDDDPASLYRVRETGDLAELATGLGRSLGSGLYDEGDDIVRVVNGVERWRTSPARMFGGRNVDPDYGWSWDDRDGYLIGTFGRHEDVPERGLWTLDPGYTASIDPDSGDPIWVRPGDRFCGLDDMEFGSGEGPWFRCEVTTKMRIRGDSEPKTLSTSGTISSFDPETGDALWTAEPAAWDTLALGDGEWVKLSDSQVAGAHRSGGYHTLDVTTGDVARADPKQVGWCFASKFYKDESSYADDEKRSASYLSTPCRVDGKAVETPAFADSAFGAQIDDVFVWTAKDGVHAVRVG